MKKSLLIIFLACILICFYYPLFYHKTFKCDINTKYLPRGIEKIYFNQRLDFVKAFYNETHIQDIHIVIEECEIKDIKPSTKLFNFTKEWRNKLEERGLIDE